MLIFCANLSFMLPQLSIHQHVTGAWVRKMFRNVNVCRLRSPVLWTNSPTLAQPTVTLQQEHLSLPTRLRVFTRALLEDASTAQVSIPSAYPSSFLWTVGSYRVLNSWKRLEICSATFQTWKSLQYRYEFRTNCFCLFVCLFFFTATASALQVNFFRWSNPFQSRSYVCSALWKFCPAFFKVSIDHLFDNLESGKKSLFWKKSQGKVEFWIQNLC